MFRGFIWQVLGLSALLGCDGRQPMTRTGPGGVDGATEVDAGGGQKPDMAFGESQDVDMGRIDAARNEDSAPDLPDAGDSDTLPRTTCSREQMYPSAPCPNDGWFLYTDERSYLCTPTEPRCTPTTSHVSDPWGDEVCYRRCKSNADCPDPCLPFCRQILLYEGNEHCWGGPQSVCLAQDRDFCDSLPSRFSN
jgi:hypothetical protein